MTCLLCGWELADGQAEDGICAACWDGIHGNVEHSVLDTDAIGYGASYDEADLPALSLD